MTATVSTTTAGDDASPGAPFAGFTEAAALLGTDWRVLWLNSEALRALEGLGRDAASVVGAPLLETFPALAATPLARELERAAADRVAVEIELEFPPTGRWYEVRAAPAGSQLRVAARDVTRRRETEERLRRSEELLLFAQRVAHVGSWEWEVGSEAIVWSDELYRIFGRVPRDPPITYEAYDAQLHPDDRDVLAAAVERTIATGEPFEVEHTIVRLDGAERRLLARAQRVAGRGAGSYRLVGTAQDVTDQRAAAAAERRLAEARAVRAEAEASQRRVEEILDSIGELFIATDRHWRLTMVNAKTERYLAEIGLSRDALTGRRLWDAVPGLHGGAFHHAAIRAVREGRVVEVEASYEPLGRWFAARIVPSDDGAVAFARDITQRKQAEAAARESHALLRTVFDGTTEAIYVKNLEGRYLLLNQAAERALGRPRDLIVGRTDAELLAAPADTLLRSDEGLLLHEEAHRRAAAGEPVVYEWSVGTAAGRRYMQASLAPLRSEDGDAGGVVGVAREITERIRAEQRQRFLSEATTLLNASLDYEETIQTIARVAVGTLADVCAVDVVGEDGTIHRAAVTHRDPDRQPLADRLRRHAPPAGSESLVAEVARTGRTGIVPLIDDALLARTARGPEHQAALAELDVRSTIAVPLVARDRILGVLSLLAAGAPSPCDPEEVALAEELAVRAAFAIENARLYDAAQRELAHRTEAEAGLSRWARIFEHAGWGVVMASADGATIEAANPAFARLHGYDTGELAGRPVAELMPPEERGALARHYGVALRLGRHTFETRHLRRDGTPFPVLVDLAPVRADDGTVQLWAVNVQDLTAQRRGEEQLRQAQKMEAVGRLAGGMAHDFNNMLMIIIGFSDFLLAALDEDDVRRADADEIRKAAERASALTQQLLAFGRDQIMPSQPVDLNAVVRGVEGMLRPVLGEHVQLSLGLGAELARVQGDRVQLEQVLMNLALNARDAMPRGGRLAIETANVEFSEGHARRTFGIDLPAGQYVMLVVSDDGVGMSAEVRSRVFEPFFTTKGGGHNSGLGLATVYGIVTRSGGYLWVDSEPGRGTTFTVCFPPAEEPAVSAAETARPARRGGTETLLVVEDEAAVRQLACRTLRDHGYRVLEAEHGRQALDVLAGADGPVHLIVTDVVMPEMTGRELGEHVRELCPGLGVLYISGYTDGEILSLDPDTAATAFLPKPFAPDLLVERVRDMLDAPGATTYTPSSVPGGRNTRSKARKSALEKG